MQRLLRVAALSIGFVVAGCGSPYDQPAPVRYAVSTQYVVMPVSEQSCIDYGFIAGTSAYDRCVTRHLHARSLGRMQRDYAYTRIVADSRDACLSYGLDPGSERYDRCVSREIDARRFRDEANLLPLPPAAPAVQYVYMPSAYDRRVATTGVEVFRDEYGFRYDSQGNRLDRFGNIVSPQSTTP
jgi:hypothetical protein